MPSLSRILTVWSYANTDIGYRQGMHEIVSRLWSIRSRESLPCTTSVLRAHVLDAAALHTLLDAEAVEADTFFLFSHLMQRIAPYYLTERSNSPALIKAVLHRVDPLLGQHLASLQLDWPPILLYVSISAHQTDVGIDCYLCMRYDFRPTNPSALKTSATNCGT